MKSKFVTKLLVLLSALSFLSAPAFVMAKESKVALVIGNKSYKDAPLKNSVNDAQDMKTALEKAGFTVIYAENADIDKMDEATDKFINALSRDSLGLFYYSGHGIQASGVNYLIPVGAKITNEATLKRQSYDVNALVSQLQSIGNPSNVVILDACRDNPYEQKSGTKSFANVSKGLAEIKTTSDAGLLIAYATTSGKTASDNQKEKNGLYTKYLKQYLFKAGLTVEAALKKVRQSVVKENPDQIPWDNSSLLEDVCLGGGCGDEIEPIIKTTYAPLLSFVSGANSINQNKSYSVKFKGTDADGDLNKILVDWGDGSAITSKIAKQNTAVSFSHTYKFAGIYDLIATAIDKQNVESETYSQEVTVKEVSTTAPVITPPVVVKVPNISNANASPNSIIQGKSITFNAKLSDNLPSGFNVKIDYGIGLTKMNGSNSSFSFVATPSDLGSSLFTVGIYDSSGNLKSNQLKGNFSVSEPAPVVIVPPLVEEPVIKTTGYSKIANDGSLLSDDAKLGSGSNDWACTKDNNTGLIWEVKTSDGGLRDSTKTYTNYTADYPKCDDATFGETGKCKEYNLTGKLGDSTNTDGFVTAVNNQSLCGKSDWRMPTNEELKGLVYCPDGKYKKLDEGEFGNICSSNGALVTLPTTINVTYFPDIKDNYIFWSSSTHASVSLIAWHVDFSYGGSFYFNKFTNLNVRLVW